MSKCKITGKVLAIQLGRQETQLAVIDKGAILHSLVLQTPGGAVEDGAIRNVDAVRQMLKSVLREKEFRGVRQAVFSLCTSQVIMETVTAPDLAPSKLEKLLFANVDMYFPVDMHDYRVVWQSIGPRVRDNGLKEQEVQLWAVPKGLLPPYYTVANACGLSVAAVDYCGHSIASAVGASFSRKGKGGKAAKKLDLNMEISFGKKKEKPSVEENDSPAEAAQSKQNPPTDLHLTMERDLIAMTFVQDGQVVFQRLIRCGANPVYQVGEVAMMVDYFRSMEAGRSSEIRGIVSGSLAEDSALMNELADMLLMPLDNLAFGYEPKWVICMGAARTTHDFGDPSLNRIGEVRKQLWSKMWQYLLLLGGALLLGAVVMLNLTERLVWESETRGLESEMQILQIQSQKNAGFADKYNEYSAVYDAYSADWDTIFASLQTYNDNLVLVLEELENTLPENTSVTAIQITPGGLLVDFACETKEEAAYLIMALRRLQYSDLLQISDLRGGGRGPATSYGSDEEPPKEGSSDLSAYLNQASVVNTLLDFGENEKMGYFTGSAYYSAPASATLSGTRTEQKIADTLYDMLVNNPVASEKFGKIMRAELTSADEPMLLYMVAADGNSLQQSGAFKGKTRQQQMAVMVTELLTKDSTIQNPDGTPKYTRAMRLAGAEKLISTDAELQSWYVYHLNNYVGASFPYLNIPRITEDLKNTGGFQTADADVNASLKKLISSDAWAYIESLEEPTVPPTEPVVPPTEPVVPPTEPVVPPTEPVVPPTEPVVPPTEPVVPPTEPVVPPTEPVVPPTEPVVPPTEPVVPPTEPVVPPTQPSDPNEDGYEDQIAQMLDQYISGKGQLSNPMAQMAIENYLLTGSTEFSKDADAYLDAYLNSKKADAKIGVLYDDYQSDSETGIPTINTVMAQYKAGTLKNKPLKAAIDRHVATLGGGTQKPDDTGVEGVTVKQLHALVDAYMVDGDTDNDVVDGLLYKYFTKGTSDNASFDKVVNSYIDAGGITVTVTQLYNTYRRNKKTENPTFNEMMKKWDDQSIKSTGNTRVDKIIQNCSGGSTPSVPNQEAQKLINDYIYKGTTGNPMADIMLNQYLTTGKTGAGAEMDKMLDDYIRAGHLDDEMKALVDKFIMNNGNSGSKVVDALLQRFYRNKTTGNALVDELIKKAAQTNSGTNDDDYDKLIGDLLGGGNKTGGAGSEPQDTRIAFTAVLGYNEELMEAELNRKGLSDEDKVGKLEVDE